MMQLQEVRDTMVREVQIWLPIRELTERFIQEFTAVVKKSKGKTQLRIQLYDPDEQVQLRLFSKKYRVELTEELITFLDENELKYTIS